MSRWQVVLAAFVTAGLAAAGRAQELQRVEFTPFYGYHFGGGLENGATGEEFEIDDSACYGGMLDFRLSETTQLELHFSRQETELEAEDGLFAGRTLFDIDVDYYHIGGTYILLEGRWQPFVVGTVGATHIDPGVSGNDSLTRFSLGVGGGVRFFPTEHFGVYLAGRGLFTFIGSDVYFRSADGETTITIDSDGLWQAELQAGVIFAF